MAVRQRSLTVLRCASAVSREDRFLKRVSQPGDDGASTRVRRPLSSSPPGWRRDTLLLLPLLPLLLSYPRQRKSSLITRIDRSLFLFPSRPSPLSRQKGETFSTDNEPHFFSRREKFEPPLNRNTIARIREIATTPSFHRLRSARDNSRAFHTGAHSLSLSLPLSGRSCETPTLHVDSKRRPERSGQTEASSRARTRVDGRIGRNWTFERIDDRVLSCLPGFSRERPSAPRGE